MNFYSGGLLTEQDFWSEIEREWMVECSIPLADAYECSLLKHYIKCEINKAWVVSLVSAPSPPPPVPF